MAGLSDYGENLALDVLIGLNSSAPATLYMALLTVQPSDSDTGSTITEPSGNGYARAAVTNNSTNFNAAASSSKTNATDITFATPSGAWGNITHYAICDAASGGNLIAWGVLTSSRQIGNGDDVRFSAGGLTLTAD